MTRYRSLANFLLATCLLLSIINSVSAQSPEELANNGNEDPNILPFDRQSNKFTIRLQESSTPALDGFMKFIRYASLY
jgi:hypothetical protein